MAARDVLRTVGRGEFVMLGGEPLELSFKSARNEHGYYLAGFHAFGRPNTNTLFPSWVSPRNGQMRLIRTPLVRNSS